MTEEACVEQKDSDAVSLGFGDTGSTRSPPLRTPGSYSPLPLTRAKEDSGKRHDPDEDLKKAMLAKIKNVCVTRFSCEVDVNQEQPKAKSKVGLSLNGDALWDRIKKMNWPVYEVPVPQDIRDVAVPREFLSAIYGGNSQETLPRIAKRFLD